MHDDEDDDGHPGLAVQGEHGAQPEQAGRPGPAPRDDDLQRQQGQRGEAERVGEDDERPLRARLDDVGHERERREEHDAVQGAEQQPLVGGRTCAGHGGQRARARVTAPSPGGRSGAR